MARQVMKGAALAAIPVLLIAVAVVQRKRISATATASIPKMMPKKHKPKSRLRYYGIGMLIGALERDATRKAVVTALKVAQRRV